MSNFARYQNLGRGPTAACSAGVDFERLMFGDGGFVFFDNFLELPTGRYVSTQSTTGTAALDDAKGGVILLDSDSTTTVQGIQLQKKTSTTGEVFSADAQDILVFECRVSFRDLGATLTTSGEFFIGLASIDTTLIATSALDPADAIGFKCLTDDGVILATSTKASTETTKTGMHTMVDSDVTADSWVKLGFRVDRNTTVSFYVNGKKAANTITTNIPTALMVPSAVCQSSGTTDPIYPLDWWYAAQIEGVTP